MNERTQNKTTAATNFGLFQCFFFPAIFMTTDSMFVVRTLKIGICLRLPDDYLLLATMNWQQSRKKKTSKNALFFFAEKIIIILFVFDKCRLSNDRFATV